MELIRENTMQVTAKEGINFLQQQRADTLLEMQGLAAPSTSEPTAPAHSQPSVVRDNTMVAAAKEGAAYLESVNFASAQPRPSTTSPVKSSDMNGGGGGSSNSDDVASTSVVRDGTMEVTAKEGKQFLVSSGFSPKKARTSGETASPSASGTNQPAATEDLVACDSAQLARDNTMQVTAKEGAAILSEMGKKLDSDAHTRGQQKQIEDISKKPQIERDTTMAVTAKEGEEFLGESPSNIDHSARKGRPEHKTPPSTSSGGADKDKKKRTPRRSKGPAKTALDLAKEEASQMLGGDVNVSEGRQLRKRPSRPSTEATPSPAKRKRVSRKSNESPATAVEETKETKSGAAVSAASTSLDEEASSSSPSKKVSPLSVSPPKKDEEGPEKSITSGGATSSPAASTATATDDKDSK